MSMRKDRLSGRTPRSMTAIALVVAAILVSVLVFYPALLARASPATINISCTAGGIGPCPANNSPRWGLDGINLDVQDIKVPVDGNYTVIATWGTNSSNSLTYSYTVAGPNSASFGPHVYPGNTGTGNRTVEVTVRGPNPLPTIVDNGTIIAKVQKHDVALTAPDLPASKKWFFGFNVPNNQTNPIVITDTDAGTPISGLS